MEVLLVGHDIYISHNSRQKTQLILHKKNVHIFPTFLYSIIKDLFNFCYLNCPIGDTLLWWRKQTNTEVLLEMRMSPWAPGIRATGKSSGPRCPHFCQLGASRVGSAELSSQLEVIFSHVPHMAEKGKLSLWYLFLEGHESRHEGSTLMTSSLLKRPTSSHRQVGSWGCNI